VQLAAIGENLIWGEPVDVKLALDDLGEHPVVRKTTRRQQLSEALLPFAIVPDESK